MADEKTNEIIVIPTLLEILEIQCWLVTIHVNDCQTAIVEHIVTKQEDFMLTDKGN